MILLKKLNVAEIEKMNIQKSCKTDIADNTEKTESRGN